ncbi:MAG: hypothetical protein ACI4MQ_01760 [Candidatus Coproplasma sp.]
MKKFKIKSIFAALAAVVFAVPMFCAPAFAFTYCPPFEDGVASTGIHCVNENSVLQVQSETLTFNIGTPWHELKEGEKYNSTVTAEYTFYNPTAETVNTKMAFPVRTVPYYAQNNEKVNNVENPITVNGQPVEYTTRHTYGTYNSFEEDVKKIKDTYYETEFFKTDLPVTEYVFKVNLEGDDYANFKVKMPKVDGTRYFSATDGSGNFSYSLYNGEKFSIFVLGNDYDLSDLNWSITRYSSLFNREIQVNGSVTLEKKMERKTFKSYVLQGYDSKSDISEIDYYNAMFEMIYTDGIWAGTGMTPTINYFTEWCMYETSVEAGGTFKNAVTANLYPTIYFNYAPYIYEYNYYLSPAREWASFGSLTVNINTNLYMQKCEYYDPADTENSTFKKTETGYSATFTSLPTTELNFKICSAETPGIPEYSTSNEGLIVVGIVFGIFFVVGPLITGLVMLIIFLVQRKKKKKKAVANSPVTPSDPTPAPELPPAADDIDDGIATDNPSNEQQASGETDGASNVAADASPAEIRTAAEEQVEHNFCVYCGSNLEKGVKFCPNCGGAVHPSKPVQPVQSAPVQNSGKRTNVLGIFGFVLSLVAVFSLYTPLCILIVGAAFGLSLAGVILRKKYQGVYGLAIAGLVISSVVIVSILLLAFFSIIGLLY